jgi:hypothetical protein
VNRRWQRRPKVGPRHRPTPPADGDRTQEEVAGSSPASPIRREAPSDGPPDASESQLAAPKGPRPPPELKRGRRTRSERSSSVGGPCAVGQHEQRCSERASSAELDQAGIRDAVRWQGRPASLPGSRPINNGGLPFRLLGKARGRAQLWCGIDRRPQPRSASLPEEADQSLACVAELLLFTALETLVRSPQAARGTAVLPRGAIASS